MTHHPVEHALSTRTRSAAVLLSLAVLVAGGASACSSSDAPADAAAPSTTVSAAASPSPTASASPSPSPSPTAVGPTPAPAPSVIAKVSRPGQPGRPTVTAAPAPFASAVKYADGIALTVDAVDSGVETGQGPGVFAGREFAVFTVTLRNGTTKPLDAQQVVVTATYGSKDLLAERVYANDTRAVDFGGSIAPGATATARYAFAVPKSQLRDARLVVDFDGAHTSAQFDGDAREAS